MTSSKNTTGINRLFAYGTLNLHDIQRIVWGEAKSGEVATLQDYELFSYNSNIMYVDKVFGETVAGKVYKLTPEQFEATDKYEGKSYVKQIVTINGKATYVYVRSK